MRTKPSVQPVAMPTAPRTFIKVQTLGDTNQQRQRLLMWDTTDTPLVSTSKKHFLRDHSLFPSSERVRNTYLFLSTFLLMISQRDLSKFIKTDLSPFQACGRSPCISRHCFDI